MNICRIDDVTSSMVKQSFRRRRQRYKSLFCFVTLHKVRLAAADVSTRNREAKELGIYIFSCKIQNSPNWLTEIESSFSFEFVAIRQVLHP